MTKISTDPPAFRVRPAQPEEAGAFFAQTPEQNAQMGAIGCVRMDFGKRGTAFWHTWHPRGREELNSPEFKAELQQVVDTLRDCSAGSIRNVPFLRRSHNSVTSRPVFCRRFRSKSAAWRKGL